MEAKWGGLDFVPCCGVDVRGDADCDHKFNMVSRRGGECGLLSGGGVEVGRVLGDLRLSRLDYGGRGRVVGVGDVVADMEQMLVGVGE